MSIGGSPDCASQTESGWTKCRAPSAGRRAQTGDCSSKCEVPAAEVASVSCCVGGSVALADGTPARGQEAARMSMARRPGGGSATPGDYDPRLLQSGTRADLLEFRHRIQRAIREQYQSRGDPNRPSAILSSPRKSAHGCSGLFGQNSINLALNVGLFHLPPTLGGSTLPSISPRQGSELFDFYAGDFWINLHDRFSITEAPVPGPTVANSGNYSQFQNAAGVTTTWT